MRSRSRLFIAAFLRICCGGSTIGTFSCGRGDSFDFGDEDLKLLLVDESGKLLHFVVLGFIVVGIPEFELRQK